MPVERGMDNRESTAVFQRMILRLNLIAIPAIVRESYFVMMLVITPIATGSKFIDCKKNINSKISLYIWS